MKLKNLCFVLAFVPFFMSCNSDDDSNGAATITFHQSSPVQVVNGNLLVTGSIESKDGTTIESIEIVCEYPGTGSQVNEATIASIRDNQILTKVSNHLYTFSFTQAAAGIRDHINTVTAIKISATVRDGDRSTNTLAVSHGTASQNLSSATGFEWSRVGSNTAVGLDMFGLEWQQNSGGLVIIVKDQATRMVKLTTSQWASLTTRAALATAINDATSITQFNSISTNVGASYNEVLGVRYNNLDYILHITSSTVASTPATGTTIHIYGQYKY